MANESFIRRAHTRGSLRQHSKVDRVLGHPVAFVTTAAILLAIFGWTFFTDPGRAAAADDPAYYTWRTEALLATDPETLLEIDGPLDMYAGGYRVATPVLGGLMRRVAGVAPLTPTVILAVGLRVLIPILAAGFAYRHRRDPLIWHAVAFGVGSLLLTPPFGGYLDNVLTLLFLTASLYLIEPMRTSWAARIAFAALLLVSGLAHPTTLAIFCLTLGAMAAVRWVYRGFALRSTLRDDGPMLAAAFAAAVATYAIWKIGIWGEPASLSEAALPPPASADFFKTRLNDWLVAMRPPLNGPLFVIGVIGLLAAGRRAAEDELARVSIVWLAPLVGIAGVAAGLAYPYYRFFNTTISWPLLIGVGGFFVARYCIDVARRGGTGSVALIGVLAVAFVFGGNFRAGLEQSHWNDPTDAWVKPDEKRDLEQLQLALRGGDHEAIVFVVDNEASEPVRIYGFAKLAGNVSRYGVPGHLQDDTAYYLGSVENFLAGEPTERDDYYEDLSRASLDDVREVIGNRDATIVVPYVFNETGSNAALFDDPASAPEDAWLLADGGIIVNDNPRAVTSAAAAPAAGAWIIALLWGIVLIVPGILLVGWALPGATWVDAFGLAPALAAALLTLVGLVVLGLTGAALTGGAAWWIFGTSLVLGLVGFLWSRFRGDVVMRSGAVGYEL